MSEDPILILQSGRLGDLIMTFPLLLDLQRRNPGRPVWIVCAEQFFRPLIPFAPDAVFFSPEHLPELARRSYALMINLGSDDRAMNFAGICASAERLGPYSDGTWRRISGFWHLYRSSLTHNNRHNSFHWSDLYRMDIFHGPRWAIGSQRVAPKTFGGRIGLVLGASECAKRPEAAFWARLARRLAVLGMRPVFLGGLADLELGCEVGRRSGLEKANFCGRLNLSETAALMRGLDLIVSPDTGPMHLADWLGVPVLNISLGPVNSRETGPLAPGQWVLRSKMSCEGCWSCQHGQLKCHAHFSPQQIASLALRIAENPQNPSVRQETGLELLRSGRDQRGLYQLESVGHAEKKAKVSARLLLDDFWREYFLHICGNVEDNLPKVSENLVRSYPRLAGQLRDGLELMLSDYRNCMLASRILPPDHWHGVFYGLRIFAGFAQMKLQNDDFSRHSWEETLRQLLAARNALAAGQ